MFFFIRNIFRKQDRPFVPEDAEAQFGWALEAEIAELIEA